MTETEPQPPVTRRSRWLVPLFVTLLLIPQPAALGLVAVMVVARVGFVLARRGIGADLRRRHAPLPAGEHAVVLGADASGRRVTLSEQDLSAHGLILGASGAGKSTTLLTIVTQQIRHGGPVVVLDLKGSPAFAGQLDGAARAAGRRLRVWTPDGPERWNPLAAGNATELKDKLIATERFTEPHYQRAAERYVQTALQVMREAEPERELSLRSVVAMMEPARLGALTRGLPRARAEHVRDYLGALSTDQLSAIRGLASRLAVISESHTGEFLEAAPPGRPPSGRREGPIDLRCALEGDEVVLFSLNSSTYGKLSAQLGTLVVQDLVSAVGRRLVQGRGEQAIVAIDEFSALGSDNVIALLARARESGVSVLLATQELADLDRAGRGVRDQVLGNTAVKIAHRQDVPESAQAIARMGGTVKQWDRTYQVQQGPLGGETLRRSTLRMGERYAVDPNAIRALAPGEAVLISKLPRARTRTVRVAASRARDGLQR